MTHVTVWQERSGTDRVVLVHGTMTWGTECFAGQRPLAADHRLELMDRRGFGGAPDTERSDYEVDAADLLALLDTPAHLVGHSYGTGAVMLAAAERPAAVRSLTLVEPSGFATAEHQVPEVAAALGRFRAAFGAAREPMDPEEYLRRSTEEYGLPMPELTPRRLRATASAMAERVVWEAVLPLEPLAAGGYPKLVVNGDWSSASPEYRAFSGEAFLAFGVFLAERIGGRRVLVPGTDHSPHQDRPQEFNRLLGRFWAGCPAE
ncbi:alpha/beta fold hydrolase [Kitasatospora viridis]|uniref:Pimeloyl-ACP methyl ester carboxylesterase n=1 Tax=Kitasatospora viridis TaxID=281105 RepID=A0A561ULL1_9ACTN|nr:alpha/beta hydrolase [Kitasatospora viridis]TWG00207.1 pimeloyl-ACP methyl ester carboxylesterase [Kitasatospora viridis]